MPDEKSEALKRNKELSDAFASEVNAREKRALAAMTDAQKEFVKEIAGFSYYGTTKTYHSVYTKHLYDGLASGTYQKPSQWLEREMGWLFPDYIFPRYKACLMWTLDHSNQWAYSRSYYRRSFRSSVYTMMEMLRIVNQFHKELCFDYDITDILSCRIPEKEQAYMKRYSWTYGGYDSYTIAYELDHGNQALEQVLHDIIDGEGALPIDRTIIEGIVKSENENMHELLGKLLLAARLQEGLRQSICETMDMGTVSCFKRLLTVIQENDLIRFSSVKRAVGTWLGLIATETDDLERISAKSVDLIAYCLESSENAEEYLQTEDSMKLYVALWSYAFYETKSAINRVKKLSEEGSHHQILTSGYFCANLDRVFAHKLSKAIVANHAEEYDILAVYLPYMMADWNDYTRDEQKEREFRLTNYFSDMQEAESYYELLWKIYNSMPKKKLEFSPCIFPWYTAVLTKSDVLIRICLIAKLLGHQEKLDAVSPLIKECDSGSRSRLLTFILSSPRSLAQKKAVTEALGDKAEWTRRAAKKLLEKVQLEEENYLQMEEMLKYKAADMRANLIEFLYGQGDAKLIGTVERLLADKKEEKRTAGLDIVMRLSKDAKRSALYQSCIPYVTQLENVSSKEQILVENIIGKGDVKEAEVPEPPLYQESDAYVPVISDSAYLRSCVELFMQYFPDSEMEQQLYGSREKQGVFSSVKKLFGGAGQISETLSSVHADCDCLNRLLLEHLSDEFTGYGGNVYTVSAPANYFAEWSSETFKSELPLLALWKEWYETNINDRFRLYRMYTLLAAYQSESNFTRAVKPYIEDIYGKGYTDYPAYEYNGHLFLIVNRLVKDYLAEEEQEQLASALAYWYIRYLPSEKATISDMDRNGRRVNAHFIAHVQIRSLFSKLVCGNDEHLSESFPLMVAVRKKNFAALEQDSAFSGNALRSRLWLQDPAVYNYTVAVVRTMGRFHGPGVKEYLLAAHKGIISKAAMYQFLFSKEYIADTLQTLSLVASGIREQDRQVTGRVDSNRWKMMRRQKVIESLLSGTEDDKSLLAFVDDVYEEVMQRILKAELRRGDTETPYSKHIGNVTRIYGIENFVAILTAMGKDTLERSSYYSAGSKKASLSHLLSVCIPRESDTAKQLCEMVSGTDITQKRLIEAALYSPEWIDIVGEYLGWEGFKSVCYYFMAHMNEEFDDVRKAMIAKYTPLSDEELNLGAFDISWFFSAYETMGEKRFNSIYDAAKYISSGSKHARARKYADAVLGKLELEDTEKNVSDKRNKDLLMAYSLIPLKGEEDLIRRYLFLQKFLKESKQFGAQRSASEKAAVGIAMTNLATNAGYTDVTRLTLRMEGKLLEDNQEMFTEKEVEDVTVRLSVDESGKTEIICLKAGKALKSVPAKLKKHSYILALSDMKKKLTEQFRRTRTMFEQAMEDGTEFTVSEISALHQNPVVLPIVKDLVFMNRKADGSSVTGFLSDGVLTDYAGRTVALSADSTVVVAHPYHLYEEGHWADYQKNLFDRRAVQVFKQVFRELYVKTEEELGMNYSRRYSGNQIQPQKTVACLKGRRWVADVEDGLQKVYYKENIVARIYALADWFSPADIEAPTLEWVEFSDRKTGKQITVGDIPDVIFSEVMRDVDLAVSVAHAGGVDPETSHSTIEMRAALLNLTLPLFKLNNVTVSQNHAIIEGSYGTYTLHLGSGVIHQRGGTMINVLPVHSQHRGRLFLPFADDDPKTAEVLTKVLLFAEDKKIKDPSILSQIRK